MTSKKKELIDAPTDKDVLCGRGKPIQHHPGNRRFLEIVQVHRDSYQNAPSRADKRRITFDIISTIRKSGGRFLQLDPATGKYQDVGDDLARDKVSHALRSRKVEANKKVNNDAENDMDTSGNPSAEQEAAAAMQHGVLLSAQQKIFFDMVSRDNNNGMDFTPRVNQEEPYPSVSCPPPVGTADKETFDELLRNQQVIFRNLVVRDENQG